MCSLSRNDSFPYCLISPICQAAGFSWYGFIYLKYAVWILDALRILNMMSFFKIVLLGLIYLRATLDLGYILMFRLADLLALSRTAPYSRPLFGCRFCQFEPNSYLDPWQSGL